MSESEWNAEEQALYYRLQHCQSRMEKKDEKEGKPKGSKGWLVGEDDAKFWFDAWIPREAGRFLSKHGEKSEWNPSDQQRDPGSILDDAQRELLTAPVCISNSAVRFKTELHEESNHDVLRRLGLRSHTPVQENIDAYKKLRETNPGWQVLEEHREKYPQYITDPIPEGIERELISRSNAGKDCDWTAHVTNLIVRV